MTNKIDRNNLPPQLESPDGISFYVKDEYVLKHLSSESKMVYKNIIDNSVCEYMISTEGELTSVIDEYGPRVVMNSKTGSCIRKVVLSQYLTITLEVPRTKGFNLEDDISNMSKLFNYLVEEGYADFGIMNKMIVMDLQSLHISREFSVSGNKRGVNGPYSPEQDFTTIYPDEEIIDRRIIHLGIFPSTYVEKKINQTIIRASKEVGRKLSRVEIFNLITGLPYSVEEGVITDTHTWKPLLDIIGEW